MLFDYMFNDHQNLELDRATIEKENGAKAALMMTPSNTNVFNDIGLWVNPCLHQTWNAKSGATDLSNITVLKAKASSTRVLSSTNTFSTVQCPSSFVVSDFEIWSAWLPDTDESRRVMATHQYRLCS